MIKDNVYQFVHGGKIRSFLHISLHLFTWIGLIALVIINSLHRPLPSAFQKIPTSLFDHVRLARTLWEEGKPLEAKRELQLVSSNVLGDSTAPDTMTTWDQEHSDLEKNYTYWQRVISLHPDYRDGYLVLASLSYKLNKPEGIANYIQQARDIDPNADIFLRFETLMR